MKNLGRIAVVALLPLLAGCFNFDQSLSVAPNGEVTMVTELAVSTEMMGMAFEGEEADEFCPTEPDEELPPTFTVTFEEAVRGEDTVCTITAIGPLTDFADALETGALMPTDGGEGAPVITLVDEGGGVFAFNVSFSSQGEDAEPNPDEATMMAMMAALFQGRTLTWSVTAPRIIDVNDDSDYVTRDGDTVTLAVPALEMISEPGIDYSLMVRFGL